MIHLVTHLFIYLCNVRDYSKKSNRSPLEIRKDASINRLAIIQSARRLFSKMGPEVSLIEIAKNAKVSRPTLYRNFPDKEALIIAVMHYNIDLLDAYSKRIAQRPDRFKDLIKVIMAQQTKFHPFVPLIPKTETALPSRLMAIFKEPTEEAMKFGLIRKDFSLNRDLLLSIMMIGGALNHPSQESVNTQQERALDLLFGGLKA